MPPRNRTHRCSTSIALGDDLSLLLTSPGAAPTASSKHFQPPQRLRFKQKLSVRHVSNRLKSGQIIATPLQKLKVRSKRRLQSKNAKLSKFATRKATSGAVEAAQVLRNEREL